jgi:nicotinamidase/pyrazinamidase
MRVRSVLLVVDYQKDFVDGALGFPGAQALEAPLCRRIERAREEGWAVWFTFDTHHRNYLETQEGRRLPMPHCIKGTEGWDLFGEVARKRHKEDVCFYKGALGSRELAAYLAEHPVEQIELCGLVSHMCVLSNAIVCKAALPECRVAVNEALTLSFDEKLHREAMDVLRGVQIDVL